jgi:hypothetical protein
VFSFLYSFLKAFDRVIWQDWDSFLSNYGAGIDLFLEHERIEKFGGVEGIAIDTCVFH